MHQQKQASKSPRAGRGGSCFPVCFLTRGVAGPEMHVMAQNGERVKGRERQNRVIATAGENNADVHHVLIFTNTELSRLKNEAALSLGLPKQK